MTPVALVWGFAILFLAVRILTKAWRRWHRFDSRRSRWELVEAVALFLVSLGSTVAILTVVLGPAGTGIRGLAIGIAWGAFLGLLIVIDTEPERP